MLAYFGIKASAINLLGWGGGGLLACYRLFFMPHALMKKQSKYMYNRYVYYILGILFPQKGDSPRFAYFVFESDLWGICFILVLFWCRIINVHTNYMQIRILVLKWQ